MVPGSRAAPGVLLSDHGHRHLGDRLYPERAVSPNNMLSFFPTPQLTLVNFDAFPYLDSVIHSLFVFNLFCF